MASLKKFDKLYNYLCKHADEYGLRPFDSQSYPNKVDYLMAKLIKQTKPLGDLGEFMYAVEMSPHLDWVGSDHFETLMKAKLIQSGILTEKTLPT